MFKKIQLIPFFLLLLAFAVIPQPVFSSQDTSSSPTNPPCSGIVGCLEDAAGDQGAGYDTTQNETGLAETLGQIVRAFLSLTGIIFISYIVYGGFLWMTGGGNEEKVTKAKSIIRNGIIGLIVILSAAAIYAVINAVITVSNNGPSGS